MEISETGLSRRQLLGRCSAAATLIAVSNVLVVSPALAIPPAAAIGIASAGLELYKMSRGGGGGIGSLLAAQTEMLRAISAQLVAIGDTLMEVYRGIGEIRDILSVMPLAVAEEVTRSNIRGGIGSAASILRTIEERSKLYGREDAREYHGDEVKDILFGLRHHTDSIMQEDSPANAPLLSLAWYAELQLRVNHPELDTLRLRERAQDFQNALNRWLLAIDAEIELINGEARQLDAEMGAAGGYANTVCFSNLDRRGVRIEPCGPRGDSDCGYARASWLVNTLNRESEAPNEDLQIFLQQAAYFEVTGIEVVDQLRSSVAPSWTHTTHWDGWDVNRSYGENYRNLSRVYNTRLEQYNGGVCGGASASPADFVREQNEVAEKTRRLRLKAIVYYNFWLASTEARRSTQAVLERLS